MRVIPKYENKQRGCSDCLHSETKRFAQQFRVFCPHRKCPYTVLDKYKTYEEFMASEDSKILVGEFFNTVAGCYELAKQTHSTKRIFSDGDNRIF